MRYRKKVFVHESFLHLLDESDLMKCDCISVTSNQDEQMIFISKLENSNDVEVRVYKAKPDDNYQPHVQDINLKKYMSTDKFATFIFNDFLSARLFILSLKENHPEYNIRPIAKS